MRRAPAWQPPSETSLAPSLPARPRRSMARAASAAMWISSSAATAPPSLPPGSTSTSPGTNALRASWRGGWIAAGNPANGRRALATLSRNRSLPARRSWCGAARYGARESGFYFTLYLLGFGEDESAARQHWVQALAPVTDALLALASELHADLSAEERRN